MEDYIIVGKGRNAHVITVLNTDMIEILDAESIEIQILEIYESE